MPARRPEGEWEAIAEKWRSSGQSIEVFCKGRRVSPNGFRQYLKRQKENVDAVAKMDFVEVPGRSRNPSLLSTSGSIAVRVGADTVVEVRAGCDEATLRTVLRVLGVGR